MEIVHTTRFDSPIGPMFAASTQLGLAFLALPHASGRGFDGWLGRYAPGARCIDSAEADAPETNREAIAQVLEYLAGERKAFELKLDLRGTHFQKAVYDEVARIAYGKTRSYGEVAAAIGNKRAVRAVGSANGANPIPLVIPCHRVVQAGHRLGGYGGGVDLKARLLAMEQSLPKAGRLL